MHSVLVGALPDTGRDRGGSISMDQREKYWFPAKRFGWGWGAPTAWQGWVVLVGYIVVVALISTFFSPDRYPVLFPIGVAFATSVLIGICLKKGEPPAWRWGSEKKKDRDSA